MLEGLRGISSFYNTDDYPSLLMLFIMTAWSRTSWGKAQVAQIQYIYI